MKRAVLSVLVAATILLAASANATASAGVYATVDSTATVTGANTVVFDFDLFNCPAGQPMVLVSWSATEPDRPEAIAMTGGEQYGLSTGERDQHLTALADAAAFLADTTWVGSGSVACGDVVVPVSGSGLARSINGA